MYTVKNLQRKNSILILNFFVVNTHFKTHTEARRDKFLMNQVVGDHGLRVVRQKFCSTLDEALAFAHDDLNVPSTDSSATTSSIPSSPEINIERNKRDDERLDIDDNTGLLGKGTNIPTAIPSDANQEEQQQSLSLLSSSAAAYCVVKPCRGVASDDVYFCTNLQDVEEAFQKIHHTPVFGCAAGETHESVVCLDIVGYTCIYIMFNSFFSFDQK